MVVLLLAILCFLLFSGLVIALVIISRVRASINNVKSDLSDFFVDQDPEGHTQFTRLLNSLVENTGIRVGQNVQAGIRGAIGGTVKGLNAELRQEAIEGDPSLVIMEGLPRSIQKSPILAYGAQRIISRILGGWTGSPGKKNGSGSGDNGHQVKFNL